jgi:hypothetical protein
MRYYITGNILLNLSFKLEWYIKIKKKSNYTYEKLERKMNQDFV